MVCASGKPIPLAHTARLILGGLLLYELGEEWKILDVHPGK